MNEEDNDIFIPDYIEDEYQQLVEEEMKDNDEKTHLIKKLKRIQKTLELSKSKNIKDIYINLSDDEIRVEVRNNISSFRVELCYYVISITFSIINLFGIFIIIAIKNALLSLLVNYFHIIIMKIKQENNIDNINDLNFYYLLFNDSLNDTFDLDLMMFMDFLGGLFLKWIGFFFSSMIFLLFNIGGLFLILNYDYTKIEKLSLLETIISFFYIFVCNIFLFIGVGSSALLSQQISKEYFPIVTSFINQKKNIFINDSDNAKSEKNDNNSDNKSEYFPFFNIICFTTIVSYLIKYILAIIILNAKDEFDKQIYRNNTDYNNNTDTDNFSIYYEIFYDNKIGSNNKDFVHNNEINNDIYSHDKMLFIIIIVIYISSIFLSSLIELLFKCFLKKKRVRRVIKEKVCQICGYFIYKENFTINKISCCSSCCECIKLSVESLANCCNEVFCNNFNCESSCCCNYHESDYDRNEVYFCYCYQERRKQKWFNLLLTNEILKKLFPYMLKYFFLQIISIGFQKLNEDLENDDNDNHINYNFDLNEKIILLIIYIICFIIFYYIILSYYVFNKKFKKNNENTIEILNGINGILMFNGLFSIIFSSIYLFGNKALINKYLKKKYLFIPTLMSMLYFFCFDFYCSELIEEYDGFEILSGSSLISVYLYIWERFIDLLKLCNIKTIFIIQFICSIIVCFIGLCLFFTLIYMSIKKCVIGKTLYCLFSYCFLFGGLWFFFERKDQKNEKDCLYCCQTCQTCCLCYCKDTICKCLCCFCACECCKCCKCCNCCDIDQVN